MVLATQRMGREVTVQEVTVQEIILLNRTVPAAMRGTLRLELAQELVLLQRASAAVGPPIALTAYRLVAAETGYDHNPPAMHGQLRQIPCWALADLQRIQPQVALAKRAQGTASSEQRARQTTQPVAATVQAVATDRRAKVHAAMQAV